VALSGEGADEVFGGYARQRYDVALDRIGGLGRRLLPLAVRLTGRRPSDRLLRRLRMPPGLHRQLDWGRIFSAREIEALFECDVAGESELRDLHAEFDRAWREWAAVDPVNGRLEADRQTFLPGDLLPKVDRMSMAHSLEVRVPYLDNEVVHLVLPLGGHRKQTIGRDKILLRKVASTLLPRSGALRRKRGFEVPIGGWLRGPLRPALTGILSPDRVARQGILRFSPVERLVEEHLSGAADHGRGLWSLMILSRWVEEMRG
jgi:asparagine synthase (glutamine-hydrolysing)